MTRMEIETTCPLIPHHQPNETGSPETDSRVEFDIPLYTLEYLILQPVLVHYYNTLHYRRRYMSRFPLQLVFSFFPTCFPTFPPSSCCDFAESPDAVLCCVVAESRGDGPDPIIAPLLSAHYLLSRTLRPSPPALAYLWMLSPAAYGS